MTRDKHGIQATLANVRRALGTPGWWRRIGWDLFRAEVMWSAWEGEGAGQWRPWDDADSVHARMALEREGFAPVGRELMRDALGVAARDCTFDSAQTWLAGLAWDGVPRVDDFLADRAGCDRTEYVRAVSAYLWTTLAGRVLEPGVKADMVPILVGVGGGQGKSSLVESLAPSLEFFGRLHLGKRDDDIARALRGKLVVELAELQGLRGRDSESTKAFIDARHDEWVPKYLEYAQKNKRRCAIVGTTDKPAFLADSAGNERRWLPVKVAEGLAPVPREEVEQLWAEGAVRFLAGGVAWRDAVRSSAGEDRAQFAMGDAVQEMLEEWVNSAVAGESEGNTPDASYPQAVNGHAVTWAERGFTTVEALQWCLRTTPGATRRQDENAMIDALGRLKFERKKEKRRNSLRDKWVWRRDWGQAEG